jgi:hypothetical protein
MKNLFLNLDKRTFLVTFQYQTTNGKFIFQEPLQLVEILKTFDKNGIKSIQELDHKDMKFKKVSKETILNFASWETEASEFLKTHYFFK